MSNGANTICVIGLGYVGLPTAATIATRGIDVVGVDINEKLVGAVNGGAGSSVEPGLDALVRAAVEGGNLRAQTVPVEADVFIIAVPTPCYGGHAPDLSHVKKAAESIAPVLKRGNLVIVESTSPIGTTEGLCASLANQRPDLSFPHLAGDAANVYVAFSAERAIPGNLLDELVYNDRVIGGISHGCAVEAARFYRTFIRGTCHLTTAATAELVKLVENAFRDVNIAFANEISAVCANYGIDPWDLIALANQHPRVNVLQPGPGVGGHCVAVDPWFIVHSAPADTPLIRTARRVNDKMPVLVVDRVIKACEDIDHPTIACLGLSYKADVADTRESPAIAVVRGLQTRPVGKLLVVEPYIDKLPSTLRESENASLVSLGKALAEADVLLLLTGHTEFVDVPPQLLKGKVIIDTRGIWRR